MTRTRTISWEDPVASFAAASGMSGKEYLEALRDGDFPPPPIAALMGFTADEFEDGRAVFSAMPDESHYNPIGFVHGGFAATLLDSAMGCAVQTIVPAGSGYATLEIKVNYLRPITRETGRVLAEGSVVHRGRAVASAEGRLLAQDSGKLLAHGTTTCMIFAAGAP